MKLAVDKIENWIFVTGTGRSGTTFVGTVLSLPLSVDYIHEPFNPGCGMPEMAVEPAYRYMRPDLSGDGMRAYHKKTKKIFSYDFSLRTPYHESDSTLRRLAKRVIGGRGQFYLRLAKVNPFHRASVIKDPTAGPLATYLHARFDATPVVVVRHPVALLASLRRVGWTAKFSALRQEPLIEDYFPDERAFFEKEPRSQAEDVAAHWRILYKMLLDQADRHPAWKVVVHEELCEHPQRTFQNLYRRLGLPWSARVENKIEGMTKRSATAGASSGQVQDFQRRSSGIFEKRRNAVPSQERQTIFEITKDVALRVYSQDSFALNADP